MADLNEWFDLTGDMNLLQRSGHLSSRVTPQMGKDLGEYFPIRNVQAEMPESVHGLTIMPGPDNRGRDKDIPRPRTEAEMNSVFINKKLPNIPKMREFVEKHETKHVYQGRAGDSEYGLPPGWHPTMSHDVAGSLAFREDLVKAIRKNKEDLLQRFPVLSEVVYITETPYLDRNTGNMKAPWGGRGADLDEIMATLGAVQDIYGVDLEQDPAFMGVFRSSKNKALWRASIGTRQTRLDARDPQPYNPEGYPKK